MTQTNDAAAPIDAAPTDALAQNNTDNDSLTFEQLSLNKPILKALAKSGYTTPTPIQAGAIPHALAGRDLLLSAQTGSGKTAAFVLPILDKLSRISRLDKHIYALILTPTRELAQQVHDSVRRYGGNLRGLYSIPLVGGAPYGGQIRALRKGVQIVIATPGRLIDHMNEGRVDLSKLEVLVLDEADRMLDMGFADDIQTILQNAPSTRQTVMSSATWDGAVGKIAESFTNNPEKISIKVESAHIEESVYFCDDFHHKNKILLELLSNDEINQAVIFTATKRSTEQLTETLTEAGFKARYLHGDLPQGKRNRIISDVKSGKCDFLIATDVAARGIDISAISHVVNYDLPRQVEDYVHRIGRCGRAGRTGVAMNLCSFDDRGQLRNINRYLKRTMSEAVVEGLEPKRAPFEQEERRRKGTRDNRKTGGRQDGRRRERFERQDRFADRPRKARRDDERFGQDDGRNFEHNFERGFECTERQAERLGGCFDERAERRFSRERQENRSQREYYEYRDGGDFGEFKRAPKQRRYGQDDARREHRFDDEKGYYRQNARQDRRFRDDERRQERDFGRDEKRFERERRADGMNDRRYDAKSERGERKNRFGEKRQQDKKFTNQDKSRQFKKPKAVEEVFFAKRQAKKQKQRFGDVD